MNTILSFWVDVVGMDKPKPGLIQRMEFEPEDDASASQGDAAATNAAARAKHEALQAKTVRRLQGLIEPFKKALMNQSPDSLQLRKLFADIGNKIEDEQFEQADADIDEFERLLDKQDKHANGASLVRIPVPGTPNAQAPKNGSAAGNQSSLNQTRLGIGPTDIIPPVIPIIKDILGPLSATCKITNNTERTLILDPASLKEEPTSGRFKQPPPLEIPKGKEEWIAVNKSTLGLHFAGVEFKVRYFIDDQKTALEMHFDNPRVGDSSSDVKIIGPNKDNFKATATNGQGGDVVFLFTLSPKGGPGQQPGTEPKTEPKAETNTSCLITVQNDTQVPLRLASQSNERGDFMSLPSPVVPPGDFRAFAYVQTPKETEPNKQGCKGSMTWQVGSPDVIWRCEWENLVAEKNVAQASLTPPGGFQSLAQVGQGDENVPVAFTISGGPAPKKEEPKKEEPKKEDPKKDEPELEFKPPAEQKQPTLRLGDKGADGWVEYLQARLNKRLNPTPNLKTDGDFGQATHKAVLAYQKQEKLQVDGVVGNQTWASLRLADAEGPSTDKRPPHTFNEDGLEARWLSEGGLAIYFTSEDAMELAVVSVGDDTKLEGQTVNVFVTAPGAKRKGVKAKIGPVLRQMDSGQGNLHQVLLESFTKKFPSTPPGADVKKYVIEGYFDPELGGDFWTSTRDEIVVKP
jgi:peptidoglycan hydrolase-like protein with peptidoglycan-binding domain